ncbi:Pr6Pr family membrane protein [Maritimibacter sp. DP1N21-5]|uniref:Pr6Pr family membrane protein n=1 Tax=Maritimibacter sp. DP1N21-5 TaxID=2836867 RepID=UPI001C46E6E0|nr:Pr6Pr family membrane protein [Maritimibacter sp. DP1N21-5]MBV7407896.1 Pr6Pr family membrane protein [Maritimibacter sp. DP1N21-5]
MTPSARFASALIALVALAALVAQFIVSSRLTGHVPTTIWVILGYFTVLTNLLVLATYAMQAVKNQLSNPAWLGGLTLWITIVGVVYHTLLAQLWSPEGLALWADQGLHTATPVLSVLFWFVFASRVPLPWITAAQWLVWPLAYTIYALLRGMLTGWYPYPFLDLAVLTPAQVAANSVGLTIAFFLGGLALVAITRARG